MFRQPSVEACQGAGACVGSPAHGLPSLSLSSEQLSMSVGSWTISAILKTTQADSPAPEKAPGAGSPPAGVPPSGLQRNRLPKVNVKFVFSVPSGLVGVMPVSFAKPSICGNLDLTSWQTWTELEAGPGAACVADAVSQAWPAVDGILIVVVWTTDPLAAMSIGPYGPQFAVHDGGLAPPIVSVVTTPCAVEPVAGP